MKRPGIIIIDGYNLAHRTPNFRKMLSINLESGRECLIRYCAQWRASRRDVSDIYIVFDGSSSVGQMGDDQFHRSVRVIYTATGETADERIIKLVESMRLSCNLFVVSDDNEVRQKSKSLGAEPMKTDEFVKKAPRSTKSSLEGSNKTGLSAREQSEITDALRKIWLTDPKDRNQS
jgi:predicted RNA-binding protein with PIN domain